MHVQASSGRSVPHHGLQHMLLLPRHKKQQVCVLLLLKEP
jgi:hypothetical protein